MVGRACFTHLELRRPRLSCELSQPAAPDECKARSHRRRPQQSPNLPESPTCQLASSPTRSRQTRNSGLTVLGACDAMLEDSCTTSFMNHSRGLDVGSHGGHDEHKLPHSDPLRRVIHPQHHAHHGRTTQYVHMAYRIRDGDQSLKNHRSHDCLAADRACQAHGRSSY